MGSVEPPVAGSGLARCGGKDMEPKMPQNTHRHMLQVYFSGCACTQPHLQAYVATTIATRANTMQLYHIFLPWFFHLQSSLSSSSSNSSKISSSSSSSSQITVRTNKMQSFYSYGITSPTFPNSESIPFSQQDSTNTIMYYYANILLLFRSIDSIVGCHFDFGGQYYCFYHSDSHNDYHHYYEYD